jgi:hypothetical protein
MTRCDRTPLGFRILRSWSGLARSFAAVPILLYSKALFAASNNVDVIVSKLRPCLHVAHGSAHKVGCAVLMLVSVCAGMSMAQAESRNQGHPYSIMAPEPGTLPALSPRGDPWRTR